MAQPGRAHSDRLARGSQRCAAGIVAQLIVDRLFTVPRVASDRAVALAGPARMAPHAVGPNASTWMKHWPRSRCVGHRAAPLGQRRSDGMMGRIRAMRFRSSGPLQVGATRVALTIGAAVRGLAAVAEPRKVAWIARRPAAGACRQVDDGKAPVDRLLIGEIGSERYPTLDRFGGGDVHWGSISSRHCSLGSGV
jgi:hypothetical protein